MPYLPLQYLPDACKSRVRPRAIITIFRNRLAAGPALRLSRSELGIMKRVADLHPALCDYA